MRIIPVSPIKQTVNYLSDFELEMQLMGLNGEDVVSPLLLDWELDFYTSSGETYKASFKNGEATNCIVGEDTITVIFDNHKMGVGTLNVISTVYFSDSRYPDGSRKVVDRGSTGISLTFENNRSNTTLTAQLVLPAIYVNTEAKIAELTAAVQASNSIDFICTDGSRIVLPLPAGIPVYGVGYGSYDGGDYVIGEWDL